MAYPFEFGVEHGGVFQQSYAEEKFSAEFSSKYLAHLCIFAAKYEIEHARCRAFDQKHEENFVWNVLDRVAQIRSQARDPEE